MSITTARNNGILFIVATPIGNLSDMSYRAIDTLKKATLILAEDTRHAKSLLNHYDINTPVEAYHEHNETQKSKTIIDKLQQGMDIALISDAGTPLICDPGYTLVKLARDNDIQVSPIPGPCAFISALSAAGVPSTTILFIGFLPHKASARQQLLKQYLYHQDTVSCYESTHRIIDSIKDIQTIYSDDCQMVLAKELTKSFEQFRSGTPSQIIAWLEEDERRCKGEFVLILPPGKPKPQDEEDRQLLITLMEELPLKRAVTVAKQLSRSSKNDLYTLALSLKNNT